MKIKFEELLKEELTSFCAADSMFQAAIRRWFDRFGEKIHSSNHCLELSKVRMYRSKNTTRYERTADLIFKAEATSTSSPKDKVLQRAAVEFSCTWPNPPPEDDDGKDKEESR